MSRLDESAASSSAGATVISDELGYLNIALVLELFRSRALSPVELVDALVARASALDPLLGAFTEEFYDDARRQALDAEARYLGRGALPRPLDGIPFVVKELHEFAGHRTTYGSQAFSDNYSRHSEIGLERLLAAGAIPLARSVTPELGISCICETPLWGVARNPWNLDCSPCGSTSGGAIAVAAGMALFADASDYGGSIRAPAGFCGTFGFKPPYGRNPVHPPAALDPLTTYGAITRTVGDTIILQNVLAGPDPRDPTSLPIRHPYEHSTPHGVAMRLAYSPDLGYFDVDESVARNAREALSVLESLGCYVDEVDLGWDLDTLAAFEIHAASAFAAWTAPRLARKLDQVTDLIRLRAEFGASLSAADVFWTVQVRARMFERLLPIFERYDALVCPTGAVASLPAETSQLVVETVDIRGREVPSQNQAALTYPFNLINQLPVASVPTGLSSHHVPTAIQIVGHPNDDDTVLALAAAFEAAAPWLDVPERRPALQLPEPR